MSQVVISLAQFPRAKQDLEYLGAYSGGILKGAPPLVMDFGRYLATKLPESFTPEQFLLIASLAVDDVERGTDDSGNPIIHPAVGQMPQLYHLVRLYIVKIAKAIFPISFADAVVQVSNELEKAVRAEKERSEDLTERKRTRTIRCGRKRRHRRRERR